MNIMTQSGPGESGLHYWLCDFQSRFNTNARAAKLAAGWDRQLLVDAVDLAEKYTLTVTDAKISEIREGAIDPGEDERLVTMVADKDTLIEIFSGEYNPSAALIDGQLEVYSDSRDKVKLEALAMVIWGV
jgi:putative sterol carrier protein